MEILIVWLSLLLLFLAAGALLGWLAFFRIRTLEARLRELQRQLAGTAVDSRERAPPAVTPASARSVIPPPSSPSSPAPSSPPLSGAAAPRPVPAGRPAWLSHLIANWMIWLGGACVALAGIFMVRYSIEVGLLGPKARVALALLTGIGLHSAAEWLRRRTGGSDPVFAALAGGGSITLYAALLAALHLYHLLDPRGAFALLALVSLATLVMALRHGPVLAAIGLVGGYGVPILVSDGSGNVVAAMVYALIISAAALGLMRYVFRPWLWWGVIAGALGWWLISLDTLSADGFRGPYLALLAWGLAAIPGFDWGLQGRDSRPASAVLTWRGRTYDLVGASLMLVVLAWGWSIVCQGFDGAALVLWAPLVAVLCLAARGRPSLALLPWLSLAVQWLAWLLSAMGFDGDVHGYVLAGLPVEQQGGFLAFAGVIALLYSGLSLFSLRAGGVRHHRLSLALLAPLLWLALAYLLVNGIARSAQWGLLTLLAGGIYGVLAAAGLRRRPASEYTLWFTLAGHAAYALAVAMYFREAGLTLALSAQLLSLSGLLHRYRLPWLATLIKLVLAVVIVRLTFNPWLLGYPQDVHWSLWTYGGATLFTALSAWLCRAVPGLQQWLVAAATHLLVMTLGAELRYWLYDGAIFAERYDLTEAAINASLWSGLAITYHRRQQAAEALARVYGIASRILLVMAAVSYGVVVLIHNPWWSYQAIAATPVLNLLLLAYGLPVVMSGLVARWHEVRFRTTAWCVAGLGLLLFVSLEIRHLWQGGGLSMHLPTGNGELYSYSIAWLVMAVTAILAGAAGRRRGLYRAGMTLLAVVIAKLFVIDMSGLDGLWRVASFMGLGLALLGLAWLYRRILAVQPAGE